MRLKHVSCLLVLVAATTALSSPPEVPTVIKATPGQLVRVTVKTDSDNLGHVKNFTDSEAFFGELVGPKGTRQFVFQAPLDGTRTSYVIGWWVAGETVGSVTTIEVGVAPIPPPKPPVPVDPPPTPDNPPAPVPVSSLRVIWVVDNAVNMPKEFSNIVHADSVRTYLTQNCTPEAGWAGWRVLTPRTDASKDQPVLAKLWADAKPKITKTPCWVIERNGRADILDFPTSEADALATVKKYKEGK